MPYQTMWAVAGRVLVLQYEGRLVREVFQRGIQTADALCRAEPDADLIHIIIDTSAATQVASDLLRYATLQAIIVQLRGEVRLGYVLYVDRDVNAVIDTVFRQTFTQYRTFHRVEDAIAFLYGIDPTLSAPDD